MRGVFISGEHGTIFAAVAKIDVCDASPAPCDEYRGLAVINQPELSVTIHLEDMRQVVMLREGDRVKFRATEDIAVGNGVTVTMEGVVRRKGDYEPVTQETRRIFGGTILVETEVNAVRGVIELIGLAPIDAAATEA